MRRDTNMGEFVTREEGKGSVEKSIYLFREISKPCARLADQYWQLQLVDGDLF